jgi:hypothetical protein
MLLARLYRIKLIQGIHYADPDPPVRAELIQGTHYAGPDQPLSHHNHHWLWLTVRGPIELLAPVYAKAPGGHGISYYLGCPQ